MATVPPLKCSSPEAEGIPSSAVVEFIRAVEQHIHPMDAVHGFMVLRHGNVVAEVGGHLTSPNRPTRSSHSARASPPPLSA